MRLHIVCLLALAAAACTAPGSKQLKPAEAAIAQLALLEPKTPDPLGPEAAAIFPYLDDDLALARKADSAWKRDLFMRVAREQFWRSAEAPDALQKLGVTHPADIVAFHNLVWETLAFIDATNTAFLKAEIVRRNNTWPAMSEIGRDGAMGVWLIAQHTDDRAFQKEALTLMAKLLDGGEVVQDQYAYLWDRIALIEGRPQRYGTQSRCEDGRWTIAPLEDAANVDAARASVGLRPIQRASGGACVSP